MTTTHRALTFLGTLTAGAMIAASTITTAHAEPAPIDDGSGPITNGAPIDDGSGTPGPSYDEPVTIPDVTADKTTDPDEYQRQVNARNQAQAQEYARLAAKAYRDCLARNHDNDTEVC